MLRFYSIIALYITLSILSFVFITPLLQLIIVLVLLNLISAAFVAKGVSNVRSKMFLKSIYSNPKATNQVAISFDDGPDLQHTPEILEVLKKYNVKASFFLIGEKIKRTRTLVEQIHAEGHLISNHSFYHKPSFTYQLTKEVVQEITQTQAELKKITGKDNPYFRPPFGVTNPNIARAVKQVGLQVIGWNLRSFDAKKGQKKEMVLQRVINNVKAGDIVLLHDTTEDIAWLMEEILMFLESKNLKAVTVEELMKLG